MRFPLLCFFLFLSAFSLSAQECYDRYLQEGIAAYESLDFETATKKFEAAKICPDRPDGEEVALWLEKAENGYLEAIKAAKEEAEQRLAELTAANERIVASMTETLFEQLHGLDFDRALATAGQISAFGLRKEDLRIAFAEMAWVYREAGKNREAFEVLKSSEGVLEAPFSPMEPDTATWLGSAIARLVGTEALQVFHNRYYPRMVPVEGGTFWMGSEGDRSWEKPVHQVTLSPFELSAIEVTAQQWFMYCLDSGKKMPPAPGWGWQLDHPVLNVSWFDCLGYCNWLSQREGLSAPYVHEVLNPALPDDDIASWERGSAPTFRLPTEAEWEYAAGGGLKGRDAKGFLLNTYPGDDDPEKVSWSAVNSSSRTHAAGQLSPNELGLYDMGGNVWEWCWDWYGNYPKSPVSDPPGPVFSVYRVIRGGSWRTDAEDVHLTRRSNSEPFRQGDDVGFRVVRGL